MRFSMLRPLILLPIVLLVVLPTVLVACGSSEPTATSVAPTVAASGNDASSPTPVEPLDTTTTSTTPPSTTAPSPPTTSRQEGPTLAGLDDCLVGAWDLDIQSFVDQLTQQYAQSGIEAEVTIDGRSTIEFRDDGGFTGGYEDFSADISAAGGALPEIQIVFSGTADGTWATGDGLLEVATDGVDVGTETLIGGQPVGDLGFDTAELAGFETQSAAYTCDDETLSFDSGEGFEYLARRIGPGS